jgi:ribosomal 50S subunit-recycling heat shock protein
MRLDKFLKVSRVIKRRTVANEACDNERVSVNGRSAKASYDVKPGDILEIRFGAKTIRLEVLSVPEFAKKDDAASLYRELSM